MAGENGCTYGLKRRDFIKVGALTYLGLGISQLLELQAAHAAGDEPQAKSVILLWMDGGPAHTDTFDPKPDAPADKRGEFKPISTNVPGIQICEHLPKMAQQMDKVTLLRGLSHDEGAHERAQHTLLTGWKPTPALVYPSVGSVTAKELGARGALPPYIAVPYSGFGSGYGNSGYLEAAYNPFSVGGDPNNPHFTVQDVVMPGGVTLERLDRRRSLLQAMDSLYRRFDGDQQSVSRSKFYERAYDMITSPESKKAFNMDDEPATLRDRYGHTTFGQSCLLARRLVEAGVRFVTVSMGGWDTHSANFSSLKDGLLPPVDQGFSALLEDLHQRGLLKDTLVVWMGEFGRTPQVNPLAGRDHWPGAQCAVIAGAGVPGGHVLGTTDKEGGAPLDHKVAPADLIATIYAKLGIDTDKLYITPQQRPVKILDGGAPVSELGVSA